MSKKDYEALATVMAGQRRAAKASVSGATLTTILCVLHSVESEIADVLADDNPRFDRSRFLSACRVGAGI